MVEATWWRRRAGSAPTSYAGSPAGRSRPSNPTRRGRRPRERAGPLRGTSSPGQVLAHAARQRRRHHHRPLHRPRPRRRDPGQGHRHDDRTPTDARARLRQRHRTGRSTGGTAAGSRSPSSSSTCPPTTCTPRPPPPRSRGVTNEQEERSGGCSAWDASATPPTRLTGTAEPHPLDHAPQLDIGFETLADARSSTTGEAVRERARTRHLRRHRLRTPLRLVRAPPPTTLGQRRPHRPGRRDPALLTNTITGSTTPASTTSPCPTAASDSAGGREEASPIWASRSRRWASAAWWDDFEHDASSRPALVQRRPATDDGDRQPHPGLLLRQGCDVVGGQGARPGGAGRRGGCRDRRHRRHQGSAGRGDRRRRGDAAHGSLRRAGARCPPRGGDQCRHVARSRGSCGLRGGGGPDQRRLGWRRPGAGRRGCGVRRRHRVHPHGWRDSANAPAPDRVRRRGGQRSRRHHGVRRTRAGRGSRQGEHRDRPRARLRQDHAGLPGPDPAPRRAGRHRVAGAGLAVQQGLRRRVPRPARRRAAHRHLGRIGRRDPARRADLPGARGDRDSAGRRHGGRDLRPPPTCAGRSGAARDRDCPGAAQPPALLAPRSATDPVSELRAACHDAVAALPQGNRSSCWRTR